MEKTYETEHLIIYWRPDRCKHSGKCVHGAPKVFDAQRRPWIMPENGVEEEIARVIDGCPSRALTYRGKEEK